MRQQVVRQTERIIALESALGERAGELEKWKRRAEKEKARANRLRRDTERARETVGVQLVLAKEKLAEREAQRYGTGAEAEIAKLQSQLREMRTDRDHAREVAESLRRASDKDRALLSKLNDEIELYAAAAQRMKIKSDVMLRVFRDWNILASWLHESVGETTPSEHQQAVLEFWLWMHQRQRPLIEHGHIETSFEDELQEAQR